MTEIKENMSLPWSKDKHTVAEFVLEIRTLAARGGWNVLDVLSLSPFANEKKLSSFLPFLLGNKSSLPHQNSCKCEGVDWPVMNRDQRQLKKVSTVEREALTASQNLPFSKKTEQSGEHMGEKPCTNVSLPNVGESKLFRITAAIHQILCSPFQCSITLETATSGNPNLCLGSELKTRKRRVHHSWDYALKPVLWNLMVRTRNYLLIPSLSWDLSVSSHSIQ